MRWQVVAWTSVLVACRAPVAVNAISLTVGQVVIESTSPAALATTADASTVTWHADIGGDYVIEVAAGTIARGHVAAQQRLTQSISGSALHGGSNTVTIAVFPIGQTAAAASTQITLDDGAAATGSTGSVSSAGATGATGSTGSASSSGSTSSAGSTGSTSSAGSTSGASAANTTVQSGITTIPAGSTSWPVTLSSSVVLNASILFFGASFDDSGPGDTQISGNLTDTTTATFTRASSGVAVTINWYVAEFASGVTVQRGTFAGLPAGPCSQDVTISAVNLSHAFPLISQNVSGGTYDNNDFVRAKLTSATNLNLSFPNSGPSGGTIDWQVVEYTNATVQSGDVVFNNTADTTQSSTLATSVTPGKSLLVFSHDMGVAGNHWAHPDISGFVGTIVDATHVSFSRTDTDTSAGSDTVSYYLIDFSDATTVQSGSTNFANADTSLGSQLTNEVDLTRSIATMIGRSGRGGKSNLVNTDVGVNSFNASLANATGKTTINVSRGASDTSTATANWSVLQFP